MEAVTTIVSPKNEAENLRQVMRYDTFGKPLLRKQNGEREVIFKYDKDKLISTIVSNYEDSEDKLEHNEIAKSVETNKVAKNDQFGRALEISGADGGRVEFTYVGCDLEIQKYYDYAEDLIHEYKLYYKNGEPIKTIWLTPNDIIGQETRYYNYKHDSKGKWIERKYKYSSGEEVFEKRTIKYYE